MLSAEAMPSLSLDLPEPEAAPKESRKLSASEAQLAKNAARFLPLQLAAGPAARVHPRTRVRERGLGALVALPVLERRAGQVVALRPGGGDASGLSRRPHLRRRRHLSRRLAGLPGGILPDPVGGRR